MASRILIIAYGNPLRCDDGVAWRAAEALEGKFAFEQVEILRLHQLVPELAEIVRDRDLVLFLDAAWVDVLQNRHPGEIHVREVCSKEIQQPAPGQFSHVYSPEKVLALARELYHAAPKAWVVSMAGMDFSHGECFSPAVVEAMPGLVAEVEQLVRNQLRSNAANGGY